MIVIKTPAEKMSEQTAEQRQASKTSFPSDKISKGIQKSSKTATKIHANYYENNLFYQTIRYTILYLQLQRG